ncbi:MAG: TVP38/TMEM64 family protein, partial [Planctomycetaceae bacterium]|nr:TVP38/TMEM64 family protein [Planctomycetaceae bacterium]
MRSGNTVVQPSPAGRWIGRVKWISVGVLVLSLLALMRALPLDQLSEVLQSSVRKWGMWGPVVFGVIYAVAVVFLVPASLLTLAAGAIFGLFQGTLIVSLSSTTGVALAFLIARYLARERVHRRVQQSPRLAAVDRAIGEQGWKIVALMRLSPAVPFTLQNYLYGVTAIRFWPCVLTSWVTMLPGTFMYVYFGSLGSQAVAGGETSPLEWTLRGVGLLATVVVTIYLTRLAKRAMQDKLDVPTEEPSPANEGDGSASPSWSGSLLWSLAAVLAVIVAVMAHMQKENLRRAVEVWLWGSVLSVRALKFRDP